MFLDYMSIGAGATNYLKYDDMMRLKTIDCTHHTGRTLMAVCIASVDRKLLQVIDMVGEMQYLQTRGCLPVTAASSKMPRR